MPSERTETKEKSRIRYHMLCVRNALSPQEVSFKSNIIQSKLLEFIMNNRFKNVMLYMALDNEVQTEKAIRQCLNWGITTMVPVCIRQKKPDGTIWKTLLPSVLSSPEDEYERNKFGVLEPKNKKPFPPEQIELVVVPGIAFDMSGYRIGYGAGYYDNFLLECKNAKLVALSYDIQVLDQLPHDPWDIPMDYIITESRFLQMASNGHGKN